MLYFYRKAFRSGKIILKDKNAQDEIVNIVIKAQDNGKSFEAIDEEYVKENCPQFVFTEAEWEAR